MSSPIRILIATLLATASLSPAVAAGATPARHCASADLRYPFEPGGPRTFGVFELRIAQGSCATAHHVAKIWMTQFERSFRKPGRLVVPRSINGFKFTTLPAHVAQTFRERGRMAATTIWFDYRIPNG